MLRVRSGSVVVSTAPASTIDVGLTVTLSPLSLKGDESENMKVITTVANTGDKTLVILKDPRGILVSFPEDTFTVTYSASSHPSFIGAKVNYATGFMRNSRTDACGFCFWVKYSPTYAAGLDDPGTYTVLPPGISIDVIHDHNWIISITLDAGVISWSDHQ